MGKTINNRQVKIRTKKFPIGIFLLLWFLFSIIVTGGTGAYFYFTVKNKIIDSEKFSKKYSITLARAFAEVAELSYQSKNYKKVKQLFNSKIEDNTIDMAFFVLRDGSIVAHSNKAEIKKLEGNIRKELFEYNTDLILDPILKKSHKVHFSSYNILSKKVPKFNIPYVTYREQRYFIKKYLYKDFDKVGWLATKVVFNKGKAIGSVNFIVSKDKIYTYMQTLFDKLKFLLMYSNGSAFGLAFFISIIVLIRYRSIQKKALRFSQKAVGTDLSVSPARTLSDVRPAKISQQARQAYTQDDEFVSVELFDDRDKGVAYRKRKKIIVPIIYEEDVLLDDESDIQDSIPVNKDR